VVKMETRISALNAQHLSHGPYSVADPKADSVGGTRLDGAGPRLAELCPHELL
jgi:hypothetical protein